MVDYSDRTVRGVMLTDQNDASEGRSRVMTSG